MHWTNESVLALSEGGDPIEKIQQAARDLVLRAKDAGWSGPPYNPAKLADILGITIRANGGIADARTVPEKDGVVIEYNPTHARERVRFSLAHEIAHLLFPDHAAQVRNRANVRDGDNWQLEMLCNIAASEFVMPFGSFPVSTEDHDIMSLMEVRRQLDVSAEAFLIRYAKESGGNVCLVVLTPDNEHRFTVDYVVNSREISARQDANVRLPENSRVGECIAIGMTATFAESWLGLGEQTIQCVAIPNRPGSQFPRVAAIIDLSGKTRSSAPIVYSHGDVRYLVGEGPKIFCQLVNNSARKWGGGVARQSAIRFPFAESQFGDWLVQIDKESRQGKVSFIQVKDDLFLASLVAQEGFGASERRRLSYSALNSCLERVRELAIEYRCSVHMPKIGTGAAGGDWSIIEDIIEEQLVRFGLDVHVYVPAPAREPELDLFA